jgi:glycosyltransferase involved in cell wall biosynthesis
MRITWVNPVFGHYRVPVYRELDAISDGQLRVVCSASRTDENHLAELSAAVGERVIALRGEWLSHVGRRTNFANHGLRVPYQRGLLRTILETDPECLIGEGFFQWTPAALAASLQRRVPLVIAYERTAHTERHAGRLRQLYRRRVSRAVDAIACNGTLSRDYCVTALGFPPERIVVGAMAADTGRMESGTLAAEPHAVRSLPRPRFLFVGRLVVPKGGRELIEGWSRAAAAHRGLGSLIFVGEGPERSRLESLARALGQDFVRFAGPVDYKDMPAYYAACDALVMPTLEDNWSLVVPEAMAAGKAVLCSVHNGCWPELVHDGENGWTFDPLDPAATASMLLAASKARDQLRDMGLVSRRIAAGFTPRRAAEAVFEACTIAVRHRHARVK